MEEKIEFKPSLKETRFKIKLILVILFLTILLYLLLIYNGYNYDSKNTFIRAFIVFFPVLVFFQILRFLVELLTVHYNKSLNFELSNDGLYYHSTYFGNFDKFYKIEDFNAIELNKGLFDKILDLGDISFSILGKNLIVSDKNKDKYYFEQSLVSLENYNLVFKKFMSLFGIDEEDALYSTKPKSIVALISFLSFTGIFFFIIYLAIIIEDWYKYWIVFGFFLFMSFVYSIIFFLKYLRLRNSIIKLMPSYIQIEYSNILGYSKTIVPYNKIINNFREKEFLVNRLFGVGDVNINTSGNINPIIEDIPDFEIFYEKLNHYININNGNNSINKEEKLLFKSKSGLGLILSLFNINLLIISIYFPVLFLFSIFIFYNLYKSFKTTEYEFYEDYFLIQSSVFNDVSNKINYSSIRKMELSSSFLFQRILGQGTIVIETDVENIEDINIYSINNYEEIYEELLERIEKKRILN